MTPRETVAALVPRGKAAKEAGEAFAPANLALVKYWGKRDETLNLPVTSSLSISLGGLGTTTRIEAAAEDRVILDGRTLAPETPFTRRLIAYLDLFREPGAGFRVSTRNSVPTAAGVASSASGFAALVLALDRLHGWELEPRSLSILARLGSGSACRSLWPGFVRWEAGSAPDGMDSHGIPLGWQWPALRIGLVEVETGPKPYASRAAMRDTREQSALYAAWPDKCRADLAAIEPAIEARDLETVGRIAESNALSMHATMLGAWPPILYWQSGTIEALRAAWRLREEGVPVYVTMDAGPNVKLLFEAAHEADVAAAFPGLRVLLPWDIPS